MQREMSWNAKNCKRNVCKVTGLVNAKHPVHFKLILTYIYGWLDKLTHMFNYD